MDNKLTIIDGLEVRNDFAKLLVIGSKPTIQQLIEAVKAYYSIHGNNVGGRLHIVLDDGNINNSDIKWCIDYASSKNDNEAVLLGKMLLGASLTQRRKLINNYKYYCQ